jgi:uncharacterized membrane protein
MSLALTLAGLLCRGRYCWLRLSLWLLATLAGLWLLITGPLFIIGLVASGARLNLLALFPLVLGATATTFGLMLPFLVLAFVNAFYQERLKGLLHLGGSVQPPVLTPPTPPVPEVAGA